MVEVTNDFTEKWYNRQYDGKIWGPTIFVIYAPIERVVIGKRITNMTTAGYTVMFTER